MLVDSPTRLSGVLQLWQKHCSTESRTSVISISAYAPRRRRRRRLLTSPKSTAVYARPRTPAEKEKSDSDCLLFLSLLFLSHPFLVRAIDSYPWALARGLYATTSRRVRRSQKSFVHAVRGQWLLHASFMNTAALTIFSFLMLKTAEEKRSRASDLRIGRILIPRGVSESRCIPKLLC